MCGIGGLVGGERPDPHTLILMADEMAHRGPDGQGVWRDDIAGLAFRRLAIIDLDPRSDQPLHLGGLHLVFNGEIYNYRELRAELRCLGHNFVTEGDGEVLLHAWSQWGELALPRLNGMFAFAIWDAERRALTAACDPFGEKPLFWAQSGRQLLFASDVRAMLRVDPTLRAPRESALGPYLARGLMPPIEQSFFAHVHRLPGSHLLRWVDGGVQTERWWRPEPARRPRRYEDAVAELRELLLDSIRLRLRSDVPVGTSLSGGVDSSAVVALCAELSADARRHAFTARFPGFERDEWGYASAVAASAGVIEHHAVQPHPQDMLDELARMVETHEEPVASSSVYAQYRVMRAAREAGVTVLLDGQGADELFGGYQGSDGWALRSQGALRELGALARGGEQRRSLLLSLGAERLPKALAARHRLVRCSPYAERAVARTAARLDPPAVDWARSHGPLGRELARQAFHTSMPALLRYADRNSMAHGREVRLPFLDTRIVQLCYSLPADYLYRDGVSKRVLRDAVRDIVPAEVMDRREKVGFETPEAHWLQTPAALARAREVLLDPSARAADLLDRGALEADLRAGRWRNPNAAWRALNLELWLRAFEGRAGAPALHLPRRSEGGACTTIAARGGAQAGGMSS
jgi:asparagine synthase (glutamine-hydrolysing)